MPHMCHTVLSANMFLLHLLPPCAADLAHRARRGGPAQAQRGKVRRLGRAAHAPAAGGAAAHGQRQGRAGAAAQVAGRRPHPALSGAAKCGALSCSKILVEHRCSRHVGSLCELTIMSRWAEGCLFRLSWNRRNRGWCVANEHWCCKLQGPMPLQSTTALIIACQTCITAIDIKPSQTSPDTSPASVSNSGILL